jgi:uncharacterized membrane protein YbjE (DUF340 family)
MKNSLILLGFFAMGIFFGYNDFNLTILLNPKLSLIILYFLLVLAGISIGAEMKIFQLLKNYNYKFLFIPFIVIIGTFLGTSIYSIFIKTLSYKDTLAIGAGFGYYSLSGILISKISGDIPGTIALVVNIIREICTLILTPLMVKYFGKLAPIASGGATSMDTTLPVITRFSGKEYAIIAVYNGIVLSILVPILISFIYTF